MHGFFTTFKISNQKIILKFLTIKNEEEYSLREEPIFATISTNSEAQLQNLLITNVDMVVVQWENLPPFLNVFPIVNN